jgi:hypothetical protein
MRRSFTLLELLLSIFILTFLTLAMVELYWSLQSQKKSFSSHLANQKLKAKMVRLLYSDLVTARQISISPHDRYATLLVDGGRSIFGIERPYVLWYVSRKDKTLCRLESATRLSFPLDPQYIHYTNVTPIATGCTSFTLTQSSDAKALFVNVAFERGEPLFFALRTPGHESGRSKKAPPPTHTKKR